MPYYCTVPRCTSMAGKAKNVSFHQFPRDEELAKLWNKILKRGKPYTKYSKVCSLHFTADDYTNTSGQKIKGQYRTLRKDAIPSQNLPTDTPMAYQRRSSWTPPTMVDPKMHQQMAQAIYVQTMLAMQAAGITGTVFTEQPSPPIDDAESSSTFHNLTQFEQIFTENEHTETQAQNETHTDTFRCAQCTKCFKDPDVFLLHKRTHTNDDTEDMLRANPILAGLLKTQAHSNVDMKNVKSIENQIMTALAANMENYLRNLSTIMTHGSGVEDENFENGTLDSNFNGNNENSNFEDASIESQNCDSKDLESSDSNLIIDEDAC
ncbi:uncharacterized protein LOC116776670 isoform X2 [Danaus plexippus]|nr:uncharacterized protein LOC116776670 isoform X2 [Danaus plexippus]